jgi:hypothetical protein
MKSLTYFIATAVIAGGVAVCAPSVLAEDAAPADKTDTGMADEGQLPEADVTPPAEETKDGEDVKDEALDVDG